MRRPARGRRACPAVTFTTDFGERDAYVAEMKAALISRLTACGVPVPPLIDVTHHVPRHDPAAARPLVARLRAAFPAGSVHLVVVDPGVGSARRPLCVESGGQFFLGPDNGLFSPLFAGPFRARTLEPPPARRASAVFDGRDLFAPAVALLVAGRAAALLGKIVPDPVRLPLPRCKRRSDGGWSGEITAIDHFGNLRTSLPAAAVTPGRRVRIGRRAAIPCGRAYADVAPGALIALPSSDGSLEIAANRASAADLLAARVGMKVLVK